jgi:hypothetical protein
MAGLPSSTSCLLRLAYAYEAYSFRKIFRYLVDIYTYEVRPGLRAVTRALRAVSR